MCLYLSILVGFLKNCCTISNRGHKYLINFSIKTGIFPYNPNYLNYTIDAIIYTASAF